MEGSLFNSGFLGSKFLWWIGQVADDRTWRENQSAKKIEDPKDGKEHINHGMLEYSKEDLETAHAYYDEYHKDDEPETGINDYHLRHQDKKLDQYCDNHPDALECRVYDE